MIARIAQRLAGKGRRSGSATRFSHRCGSEIHTRPSLRELERLRDEVKERDQRIAELERQIKEQQKKLGEAEKKIGDYEKKINEDEKKIADLERQLALHQRNSTNSSKPPSSMD